MLIQAFLKAIKIFFCKKKHTFTSKIVHFTSYNSKPWHMSHLGTDTSISFSQCHRVTILHICWRSTRISRKTSLPKSNPGAIAHLLPKYTYEPWRQCIRLTLHQCVRFPWRQYSTYGYCTFGAASSGEEFAMLLNFKPVFYIFRNSSYFGEEFRL